MTKETANSNNYIRCPNCIGPLANGYCSHCDIQFEQLLGILDLRWPKAVGNSPAEAELIQKMVENFSESSFESLNQLRFQKSKLPDLIRDSYQQYAAQPQNRSQQMLDMFQKRVLERFSGYGHQIALDLGCGVGASSQILARQFETVIGIDSDFVSLILAQKYLEEQGVGNVILACAYAQKLPIASEIVDYAIAQNVLEHLFDVETALRNLNRVLNKSGCFCGDSRNRYDLLFPEPHVKLHWVGFWPRRWQAWYVWQFRKTGYEHTQLLSLPELNRHARKVFGQQATITFPYSAAYNRAEKWDGVIQMIEKIPVLSWLALLFFPSHLFIAQAGTSEK